MGANKILRTGDTLFKAGDKSEGMFIVRKGELRVFLEKDGTELTLATIPEGSIVGEMALFDKKPRSACVKAQKDSEVTLITNDDFGKLLKQIPKWFLTLMEALSGRLRATNERLQKLESGQTSHAALYQNALRVINIITLFWYKDGVKIEKGFTLDKKTLEKNLQELFNEPPDKLKVLFETFVAQKIFGLDKDGYGNAVFTSSNRGALEKLITFIRDWLKRNPTLPSLPLGAMEMLELLGKTALASAYETTTMSFADLEKEGQKAGFDTATWQADFAAFKNVSDSLQMVKASGGAGLKIAKKDVAALLANHRILVAFAKAGLAQLP